MNQLKGYATDIKLSIKLLQQHLELLEQTLSPQEYSKVLTTELNITSKPKTTKALLKAIGVIEQGTTKTKTKKILQTSTIQQAAKATATLRALLEKDISNIERSIIEANLKLLNTDKHR